MPGSTPFTLARLRFAVGVVCVIVSTVPLAYGLSAWTQLDADRTTPQRVTLADAALQAPVSNAERPWVEVADGAWWRCRPADAPRSTEFAHAPALLTNPDRTVVVYVEDDEGFPCELLALALPRGYLSRMSAARYRQVLTTEPVSRADFAPNAVFYDLARCGGRSTALGAIAASAALVALLWSVYPLYLVGDWLRAFVTGLRLRVVRKPK